MLTSLAHFSYRRRRLVVAAWIFALVVALLAGPALAGKTVSSGRLPHTDSQAAYDTLARSFPSRHGDQSGIVFADIARDRIAANAFLHDVVHVPGVLGVSPLQVAPDGHVAVAMLTTDASDHSHPSEIADAVVARAAPFEHQGMRVEFGGDAFNKVVMPKSEGIGVLAAVIVLLIVFGSLIAMGVPILTALVGIGIALTGVGLVAHFFTTPDFAGQVASMIGIGVGIDYALFMVTRYREALHRGAAPEAAVVEAMNTSGRAVVFAAFTVMVSVLGMFLMGIPFLDGLAVGISLAVAIAVFAAITLLPALLGFAGHAIDRFHVPHRAASGREAMWHRWARIVQRRPLPIAIGGFVILIALALPALHMRMGQPDARNNAASDTTHRAYTLVASGFGAGANGPIVMVAEAPRAEMPNDLDRLSRALHETPGIVGASQTQLDASGAAAVTTLYPVTGPQDARTATLVHELREKVAPEATRDTNMRVHFGGPTASAIDSADLVGRRLPIFIGAVLALSFLLLLLVFRSILVPLKAVLMNLLSIGAAYGIIVAVFQWGWGASLLHVSPAPIAPWIPMMLFAVVFGMSMDYEVFLLSAVREHYDRSHNNSTAVAEGLGATARVITAAALIMVCVFGSFVVAGAHDLKEIGFGLAIAIAIDATIVRVFLVPATMELLGDANWWFPRRLRRFVPTVRIEAEPTTEPALAGAGR